MRFDNNKVIYYEVDDSVLHEEVFRLMLQPMVENAYEHSGDESRRIIMKIKIFDRQDHIEFTVIDNGKGISESELEDLYVRINDPNSKSIGLTNVNRRLILNYGSEYGLRIKSKVDWGTIFQFSVPKQ